MPFVCAMKDLGDMLDPDAVDRAGRAIAERGVEVLVEETQDATPIGRTRAEDRKATGRPPGTARGSVHAGPVARGQTARGPSYRGLARTEDPIFPYIEFNTKPHWIRPRKDRAPASVVATRRPRGTVQDGRAALSWVGPFGRVFAKKVWHPGTTGAHPFLFGAIATERRRHTLAAPALRVFARDLARRAPPLRLPAA